MTKENLIVRSRAPLRLGLGGGGTDVHYFYNKYDGAVLNATIDMYAYCVIKPTNDNKVSFHALDLEIKSDHSFTHYIEIDHILPVHKAIYNHIVKNYNNNQPIAHEVLTYSDVPPGSGLGSSSTLTVAIIKAYMELLSLPFGDYDVSRIAYTIERSELGMEGGKQDQYAATFGGFNFMEFGKHEKIIVNPLRVRRWIINELEQSIVLFNTGVSRESSAIITEQGREIAHNNPQTIQSMLAIKEEAINIKNYLLTGQIDQIAFSVQKGWEAKKRSAKSISNKAIDDLYNRAIEAGAVSGKVSGAGGGGFMMFFVNPEKRSNLIKALEREKSGQIYNCRFVEDGTQSWVIKK